MKSGPNPNRLAAAVAGDKPCPICLNQLQRHSAAIIPCFHAYCTACIRRWSDLKRKCPLCSADFASWFVSTESTNFREEVLPRRKIALSLRDDFYLLHWRRRAIWGRSREHSVGRRRSDASVVPRRRSFVSESSEIADQRVREWRASVYERRLQAVALPATNGLVQRVVGDDVVKELLVRRIEPWIQRELHAVLGDPDPTVIVHVVTSLFISQCERGHENVRRQVAVGDDFLAPVRPFLHEHTEIFWHELRCFAESLFSMETYDTVVEYKRMD